MTETGTAERAVDASCPRCNVKMRLRKIQELGVEECPVRCGIFVEVNQIQSLLRLHVSMVESAMTSMPQKATLTVEGVKYLNCPSCAQPMTRVNDGGTSGVMIDVCGRHGLWMDSGELEKISSGGVEEMKRYQTVVEKVRQRSEDREENALKSGQDPSETKPVNEGAWSMVGGVAIELFVEILVRVLL